MFLTKTKYFLLTTTLLASFAIGSTTVSASEITNNIHSEIIKKSESLNYSNTATINTAPANDMYGIFMRGLLPQGDNISANGNLTTNTTFMTFDIMQLGIFDTVKLTDSMNGQTIDSKPLTNKEALNRITFSNLKGKLTAGKIYNISIASSTNSRQESIFNLFPVE